jgi:hypothetical protein
MRVITHVNKPVAFELTLRSLPAAVVKTIQCSKAKLEKMRVITHVNKSGPQKKAK